VISKSLHKKIHVLGLGPVGLATTWELLNKGYAVHAYDISSSRVSALLAGQYEFPDSAKIEIDQFIRNEKLKIFSTEPDLLANEGSNLIYICIATPTQKTGIDLSQISQALTLLTRKLQPQDHLIFRSTLQPGCMNKLIRQHSLNTFKISFYPEFLREKHIIDDILSPPLKISCHNNSKARDEFLSFYENTTASLNNFTDVEMVKVACNMFHALKVTFANEILRASTAQSFDAKFVMSQLTTDKKLNLSELYLTPGKAFAGHCLEKDLTAYIHLSQNAQLELPLIQAILDSNNLHKKSDSL
jgi:GDP-mannose 6-dehydrogenase